MKTNLLWKVFVCVSVIFLMLTGIYLTLGNYYEHNFMVSTWINGVYCTGKDVEEVGEELLSLTEAPLISIQAPDGQIYEFYLEKDAYTYCYDMALRGILDGQNGYAWPKYLFSKKDINLIPSIVVTSPEIFRAVTKLDFYIDNKADEGALKIDLTEDGYVLHNTLKRQIDDEKLVLYLETLLSDTEYLVESFKNGVYPISISDADCYRDIVLDDSQKEIIEQWKILETYVHSGIIYNMGDEMRSIAGRTASSFIQTDEAGNIIFDEENHPLINDAAIEEYIKSLADEYNTWKGELTFTSTAGEVKKVPYVNYGTELDVKKETVYLKEAFRERRIEVHVPAYIHEGSVRGKNDIGDTYIEVDMGNQKLYAYLDGELLVETDIVTGNVKNKTSTPEGVVYVYAKQRNRTLRGPGYAAYVKYWMPVKGGIGLHDASWRKKFGGEIYKKDGSHGCINIPKSVMPDIYENYEIGTPVIMFY